MKTIEEAAKEYADRAYPKVGLHEDWVNDGYDEGYNDAKNRLSVDDFKSGVEFAQCWIAVEEELPEKKSHNFSDLVLTKNKFDDIRLERYDFEFNHFNSVRYDAIVDGDGQVTHWRPIERR